MGRNRESGNALIVWISRFMNQPHSSTILNGGGDGGKTLPFKFIELEDENTDMSESQLVSAIIKRCWLEKSWLSVDRANSGARTFTDNNGRKGYFKGKKAGTPDIEGFYAPNGTYLGIEAKLPSNKQTPSQIEFEADVRAKGGVYRVVHSLDELELILKEIRPDYY